MDHPFALSGSLSRALAAAVVVLCVLFSLFGCGQETALVQWDAGQMELQSITGVYHSRPVDCAPLFNAVLTASLSKEEDKDYAACLYFDECYLRMTLTVEDDGTLCAFVNEEDLRAGLDKYLAARREKLQAYFTSLARQKGLYLGIDEIMQQIADCDFETYLHRLSENFQWEKTIRAGAVSCHVSAKDKVLFLYRTSDDKTPLGTVPYERSASTITFLSFDGNDAIPFSVLSDNASLEEEARRLLSLPITFYRAG